MTSSHGIPFPMLRGVHVGISQFSCTMKTNLNTNVIGNKVVLVPYSKDHVPRYHEWMQNTELQELTASEPLTLEEEYQMQTSWAEDEKKCTFIVLDADLYVTSGKNEIEAMVGDVNLFFNYADDAHAAELEIMIAESHCRGKGLGKEAALAMMKYGIDELGVQKYSAKIGMTNEKSLNMFHKFGFKEVSRCETFKEVTLELPMTTETTQWLTKLTTELKFESRDS